MFLADAFFSLTDNWDIRSEQIVRSIVKNWLGDTDNKWLECLRPAESR